MEHIIYLGGLADPEQHIALTCAHGSKRDRALREGRVLGDGISGGRDHRFGQHFEMIRFMTELFPILPGPL